VHTQRQLAEWELDARLGGSMGERLLDGVVLSRVGPFADPELPLCDAGRSVPGEHESVPARLAAHVHVAGERRPRAQATYGCDRRLGRLAGERAACAVDREHALELLQSPRLGRGVAFNLPNAL